MASLGNDLATIRKKKDLSIEDVQDATKIPAYILNSIEDDSIFAQLESNSTYTRSYVRSYARSLGVKEEDIVHALNQQAQGSYDGSLIKEEEKVEPESESENKTEKEPNNNQKKGEKNEKPDKIQSPQKEKKKAQPAPKKKPKKSTPPPATAPKRKITAKDWDWVRVGEKARTSPSKASRRNIILLVLLIIILLAAGYFAFRYYYEENNADTNAASSAALEQPDIPSDSLRQALTQNDNQPAMTADNGNLPDTLSVSIYAANGQLEPVHVYTDILAKQNSKTWTDNPYWIKKGDTLRFNFVNTMRVRAENQYDRMELLINGHEIPNFYDNYYSNATEFVELTRSVFANHPDWLQPAK